ncbi:MAG TPA: isochorismatase family protein [Glaciihabitans sp.]|jgi:nicotinamidase/pyrazinamidase|nr:isochorismatase family protein [Glaciihabitans sp.]
MARALFVIDVQNDFTEGGALGVDGGNNVAAGVTDYLRANRDLYTAVFASRDWHDAHNNNGGHFATGAEPDFVDTWPPHCVAGTPGAEFHPAIDTTLIDVQVKKGQGKPAYSIFEGTTEDGATVEEALQQRGITEIDVVGIATDYCVRASALDALNSGGTPRQVRVLTDLVAGVAATSSMAALAELGAAGIDIVSSTAEEATHE